MGAPPDAVVADPVSAPAPTQVVGHAVAGTGGSGDSSVPAEGTADPTSPSQETSPASGADSNTDDPVPAWVATGSAQEREGGASAPVVLADGNDMLSSLGQAGLCGDSGGGPTVCAGNSSLAAAVAAIVRRLADTGRELVPVIALGLFLAAIGALALSVAGRRSSERCSSVGDGSRIRSSTV